MHWLHKLLDRSITHKQDKRNVAEAFVNTWITWWGVSLHVITDYGKQFKSELFAELSKVIGFYRLHTTAYHSQYNGLVDRFHKIIKTAIIAQKESWLSALPIVLIGTHTIPNGSDFSCFYAVTRTQILLSHLLIVPTRRQ